MYTGAWNQSLMLEEDPIYVLWRSQSRQMSSVQHPDHPASVKCTLTLIQYVQLDRTAHRVTERPHFKFQGNVKMVLPPTVYANVYMSRWIFTRAFSQATQNRNSSLKYKYNLRQL